LRVLPGQYYDAETGLHYNYFRDYDPRIGRYVQSDPIGLEAGVDTYGYVGSDPLGWVDLEGLARFSAAEMRGMIARNNSSGYSNELILCLAWNESNFDPFRVSGTGPVGLMMMSPIATRQLNKLGHGFDNNSVQVDPEANVGAGTAYLGYMRKRFKSKNRALQNYGTGRTYPAQAIINCEKCLQQQLPCADSKKCLEKVHK
jgi:RHS repeat-associated protein